MSKEELAGLDAALSKNDAEIIQQNWGDQHSEDRWSHCWDCFSLTWFFCIRRAVAPLDNFSSRRLSA